MHECVDLATMASAMDSGARPPSASPTGARRRGRRRAASSPISVSSFSRRIAGPSRPTYGISALRERAQVREIRRQVVAHDDRRGEAARVDSARAFVGPWIAPRVPQPGNRAPARTPADDRRASLSSRGVHAKSTTGSVSGPAPSSSTRGGNACARPKIFAPGSRGFDPRSALRVASPAVRARSASSGAALRIESRGRMTVAAVRADVLASTTIPTAVGRCAAQRLVGSARAAASRCSAATRDQQDVHGAFAAHAQSPKQVVRPAQVVADDSRRAGFAHGFGVLAQVAFEAAADSRPA